MKKILKITLNSDLCASSGEGYATSIDNDVSYTAHGLPFIPARRLKGCLRDAAAEIGCTCIDELFGQSGSSERGSLTVGSAYLKNNGEMESLVVGKKLDYRRVLDMFTYTRAQTSLTEGGVAAKNTLRFMRVVSKISPLNKEKTEFFAELEFADEYENDVDRICRALRNIGYNRARGLGAVRCTLEPFEKADDPAEVSFEPETEYTLTYKLKTASSVMVPALNADESADFIPGTAVLGCLAGRYLKSAYSEDFGFEEMFLSGSLKFSNIYPIAPNGKKGTPAPAVILKRKGQSGSNKYISFFADKIPGEVLAKPLSDGYVDEYFYPFSVKTSIAYHNSLMGKKAGGSNSLYMQKSIDEGQIFYGTISGKGKYIAVIYKLIAGKTLSFGRSRTAQYSQCLVTEVESAESKCETLAVTPGEKLVWIFDSDAILADESGICLPTYENALAALGLDRGACEFANDDGTTSILSTLYTTTVTGYNAKRNQKNPHIKALKRGSCIVFAAQKTEYPAVCSVGLKTEEGFGCARLVKAADVKPVEVLPDEPPYDGLSAEYTLFERLINAEEAHELRRAIAVDYSLKKWQNSLRDCREYTSAFIGRFTLMTVQAVSKKDLLDRVNSVRDDNKSADRNKREISLAVIRELEDKLNGYYGSAGEAEKFEIFRECLLIVLTNFKNLRKQPDIH